ncbi:MAG: spermidine/putrescine ABC transporter substrate-binding protein [Chloroflexi bacterium]|nr:spermidine/putrescine ABC transporter substrate-binding protein [Chloroflexota bacterium]MBU1659964.1 spermidine/putrescine ABC transporter substrate-binding protein [Chloroflexota bacterium]
MTKKSLFLTLGLLVILSLTLSACGGAAPAEEAPAAEAPAAEAPAVEESPTGIEPAKEIVFYIWSEYIDPEIYTLFEEETGIKVVEDNFSNNEELLAKLQGGAAGYAVIVPSDYTVSIMIAEGMLARLDHANVPNLSNLSAQFQNVPYDPSNIYCAPYQWGTTGIGYLDGEVEEPTSWAVLFEPDEGAATFGRTTMLDDVREAFAAALVYLGYDINTTDEAQLEEAKTLLIQAKAGLSGYDSDTYEDLIAAGENLMAHGWNGDFLMAQEENENIAYTIPQEGGVVWVDNVCIPAAATSEEQVAGELFINFLLSPEIGAMLSEFNWYASPNAAAEELLDEEFLSDPTVYPPAEVLEKLQYIKPLGEAESLYQRMWDEIKSAQ